MIEFWNEYQGWIVTFIFVGLFLFVIYKGEGSLRIIPESIKEWSVKLYNMLFRRIEDEDAYNANADQRKADEEYKKQLKKKKS